jgi:hypothetical protein
VTVECLDAGEDLSVVSAGDQDLCARADGGLEDGEGSGGELVLFNLGDFVLAARLLVSHTRQRVSRRYVRQF